jgi:hypothetical protein
MSYLSYTLPRDPVPRPFAVGDCLLSASLISQASIGQICGCQLYHRIWRSCSHTCVARPLSVFVHLVSLFDVFPCLAFSHPRYVTAFFARTLLLPDSDSPIPLNLPLFTTWLFAISFFFPFVYLLPSFETVQKLSETFFSNAPKKVNPPPTYL